MIQQLVANGDDDRMLPTSNTVDTNERFLDSRIAIHLDAGHGGARRFDPNFPLLGVMCRALTALPLGADHERVIEFVT